MSGPVRAGYLVQNRTTDPAYCPAPAVPVEIDPATEQVIDELFLRLQGACGAWRQSWPNQKIMDASKLEWLAEFMRSGITSMDQLRHGMRMVSASKSAFVPAPGVFVSWCFAPEGLGLPSVEVAYSQALRNSHPGMEGRGKWFHPAIYHATAAAGFLSLQTLPRDLGMTRFEQKYLEQCRKIWRGEPWPVPTLHAESFPGVVVLGYPHRAADSRQQAGRSVSGRARCGVGGCWCFYGRPQLRCWYGASCWWCSRRPGQIGRAHV